MFDGYLSQVDFCCLVVLGETTQSAACTGCSSLWLHVACLAAPFLSKHECSCECTHRMQLRKWLLLQLTRNCREMYNKSDVQDTGEEYGLQYFSTNILWSASAGKWDPRLFKELSLCGKVAPQHCTLSLCLWGKCPLGGQAEWPKCNGALWPCRQAVLPPPPACQAPLRSLLNRDDSFHSLWVAGRAMRCQPRINSPPPQLGVIKLSKRLHSAHDVSALCLSITNGLSGEWFPPYIRQERWHFAAVTPCLLLKSVPPVTCQTPIAQRSHG